VNDRLITFTSGNGNDYFYDPLLKEIYIYSEPWFSERAEILSGSIAPPKLPKPLTAKDVEYHLANLAQITIEMTEKCNLNCHYCAYGNLYSTVNRTGADIPFSFIRNILLYINEKMSSPLNISDRKPFYISFYGGEPLLAFPRIKETVELVTEMNFPHNAVCFSMTTNGYFLDKYMDYLAEHNVRLLISLDGDGPGNRLRVDHNEKPQFAKIFANTKLLQTRYPDYFKANVNFNAVLNKHNSTESITNFIENHFGKLPTISSINPSGLKADKVNDFYKIYTSTFESFHEADRVMDSKEKFFIHHPEVKEVFMFLRSVCGNSFTDYNSFLADESKGRLPTGTCLPFAKRMFVAADGLILPCENVPHDAAFGRVNEKGVDLDPGKIAGIYNHAFQTLADQCGTCLGKNICSQCVFQMETRYKCSEMIGEREYREQFSRAITFVENNPELYVRLMKEVCVE